jgi:hypothetical protein
MRVVGGPDRGKPNKLDGVTATANFATETAQVRFPSAVSADDLISVVRQAGYTAVLPLRTDRTRPTQARAGGYAPAM